MQIQAWDAAELLGPFNETEEKFRPKTIYTLGDVGLLRHGPRVSIVGSRSASDLGLRRAMKLARKLSEQGVVIVSGLATGIDTAAHRACIESNGRTIAVLGTPLDQFYPKENRDLQQLIMEQHLCVSQFPVGQRTQRHNFPTRNRTMALISDATVIIEAGEKSGSIHQGWEALRLGRTLFLTESLANNTDLPWCSEMRHYGAEILSDRTLDVLMESLPTRDPDAFNLDALSL